MQKVYKYIPERPAHNVFHLIPPIHHSGGKSHQYVLIPVCSRLFRPDYADYTITVILLLGLPLSSPDRQNQSDRCYPHRSMEIISQPLLRMEEKKQLYTGVCTRTLSLGFVRDFITADKAGTTPVV